MYQVFINHAAEKVHELENEYKKLSEKLAAKLDDIFEPTIKISLGTNEIVALCDLGANVSTISKTLFHILDLHSFMNMELKLHLDDSTYKKALGIKQNIVLKIKDWDALIDLVTVDMPEDNVAHIILGWALVRTVKALINHHEGNVRFEFTSHAPFIAHFPRK
jgi:hypothetical protein